MKKQKKPKNKQKINGSSTNKMSKYSMYERYNQITKNKNI